MNPTPTPIEKWARETARSLVTVYLDTEDDLDLEQMIADLLDTSSHERLGELLLVLVAALGDVFDDLQDYSQRIVSHLGEPQG